MQVTLAIPDQVEQSARRVARETARPVETVLAEWLERFAATLPVESLGDEQVVALSDLSWPAERQSELGTLLAAKREGLLDDTGHLRLAAMMQEYDRDLLRKAEALREAVQRGLRHPPAP